MTAEEKEKTVLGKDNTQPNKPSKYHPNLKVLTEEAVSNIEKAYTNIWFNLSKLIKAKREELNISTSQLAQVIHHSEALITEFEAGNSLPNIKTLITIMYTLNIPFEELLNPTIFNNTKEGEEEKKQFISKKYEAEIEQYTKQINLLKYIKERELSLLTKVSFF